ncbi:cytochrome P450 [Flagelloscypha sp. PMI_526]|nr:cytochrome P450 [Flagelloscypha sp. PMI_526]
MPQSLLIFAFAAPLFAALIQYNRQKRLPPGPIRYPFFGNLFQIPKTDAHFVFYDWAQKYYGPMIYLKVFGRNMLVLNGIDVMIDLLEKNSDLYSSRPRSVMAGELVGRNDTAVLFHKYTSRLREARQILHSWMNPRATIRLWQEFELNSLTLMDMLLDDPKGFQTHIRSQTGSMILKLTYGITTIRHNDPDLAMAEGVAKITAEGLKLGRWLVDFFPVLKYVPSWIPGAGFQRWAAQSREHVNLFVKKPYDYALDPSRDATSSWVAARRQHEKETGRPEKNQGALLSAAASVYAGGIETTAGAIRMFILMMIRHPDIQARCQAEIDDVVGHSRLPTLEDWDKLPYLKLVITETIRMSPVATFAVHSADVDTEFRGYHIPAGTWIMGNFISITRDENVYKDAAHFNPDRYTKGHGPNNTGEPDLTRWLFGFGRRVCPGRDYALAVITINAMNLLWGFNAIPVTSPTGEPRVPEVEFIITHLSLLAPYDADLVPRSSEKAQLIKDATSPHG